MAQIQTFSNPDLKAEDFTPDPIPLLESNRNLGYSLREAVADLIDNSISAGASIVELRIDWNSGQPTMTLKDNGRGMDLVNLVNAFKLGSTNPLDVRDPKDLGRFGFGMKTASISQARCLTVVTQAKDNPEIFARSLDLDFIKHVKSWSLKHVDLKSLEFSMPADSPHGTIIFWDHWDRAPSKYDDFVLLTQELDSYLAVCFHRFIEKREVKILHQGVEIESVSPIPKGSQEFSRIPLPGYDCFQTAYTLQHPNYWEEDFNASRNINSYRLFEGLERQQGIYIYRCNRLLTPAGGWLGLVRPANSAKLSRVVIDYPNNADHLWSLDITKTNAEIPFEFKEEIKEFLNKSRLQSIYKVNRRAQHEEREIRGRIGDGLIWKQDLDPTFLCWRYKPNINHAVFRNMIETKSISRKNLEKMFELISNNLPVAKIIQNNDEDPGRHDRLSRNESLTAAEEELAIELLNAFSVSLTRAKAIQELLKIEPWCYHSTQLKKLFDEQL